MAQEEEKEETGEVAEQAAMVMALAILAGSVLSKIR